MTSIFISYSSKDVQIAEIIHKLLEFEGFDVWRDKRSIEADWSNEISDALTRQDIILLLWTKNASESDYVKSEWMTARALGKVIKPILFSKDFPSLQLPKPLENVQAIANLERVDDMEKNIQKLLYPLEILSKERTPFTFKYDYNILTAKHQIPFLPNPDFVGRADELVRLYLDVIGGLNKLNYAHLGIVGIGGVGKTQLAVEFTYRYAFQFEKGIYWIQGADQSKWLSQIVAIAKDIGLEVPEDDDEINRDKNYFHAFYNYCKEFGSKVLLIIDNVEDPRSLNDNKILFHSDPSIKFRLLELECNILFTTRRDFVLPGTKKHIINLLSPESSLALLIKYRKSSGQYQLQGVDTEEENYARMICNAAGYLPLALVVIQAYLRKYRDISFRDYYEEFVKSRLGSIDLNEVSEDELATRHSAAIRVTLDQDWKILEASTNQNQADKNQNSKKILSLLSLFPESALVLKARLMIFSGIERYGKTRLVRPAESAFIFLDELNLIDVVDNNKSVRIHPLLREYVLEKLEEGTTGKQTINLKVESILNLKAAYCDNFPSLVQEYVERNNDIDSLSEDLEIVLLWLKELESHTVKTARPVKITASDIDPIYKLNKIIDQERHNLRPAAWNDPFTITEDKRNLFAQSMLIRSFNLNHMEIANKSREFLLQQKKPFLDIRWARVNNNQRLIRTLEGHTDSVGSVTITPDNTKIISGSNDNTIKVWDLNAGKLLNTLEGHSDYVVNSVAITPYNNKIVSGSADSTINMWDMNTGELLNTLKGHSSSILSVAITPYNNKIVSGSVDRTIKIWDLNTGKLLNTLEGHSDYVSSISISPDSTKVASGSYDNTIKIWDLNTGKLLNTLEGHSSLIRSVAITPYNNKIVSASSDNTIKIWDLNTGKLLKIWEDHSVESISISPDSTKVASGSYDSTIRVWDLNTDRLLITLVGHSSTVNSIAITSDNSKIVSGSGDHKIKVWDLDTNRFNNLKDDDNSISFKEVAISPDNTKLVFSSRDNTIRVWDLNTGRLLDVESDVSPGSIAISPDNSKIVSGARDNTIRVWDLNTGRLLQILVGHTLPAYSVAITPDNTKIISGSNDNTIKVWDLNAGKLLNTLEGHSDLVTSVSITSDNSKIVSGSSDNTIKVWDLSTYELLSTLEGHSDWISSVSITSDNSKIVSGSSDNTIRIWDLDTSKVINILEGHTDGVSTVTINPDNTKIVSGSDDGTIKVWEMQNSKYSASYKFDSRISSISFFRNRNIIVVLDDLGNLFMASLIQNGQNEEFSVKSPIIG